MTGDYDTDRILAIAQGGLADSRDDAPDDLRLDTFAIVACFAWTEPDGDEREGIAVWSESRRRHVQVGLLSVGLDRLNDTYTDDD